MILHGDKETGILSTNSQASFVLGILDAAGIATGDNVLEIGSGSGWLAAVMTQLVGSKGHVTGLEIIEPIAQQSMDALRSQGVANAEIIFANGSKGWPSHAPYDVVIFTAASWSIPEFVFDEIKEGGKLVIPITNSDSAYLVLIFRKWGKEFRCIHSVPGYFVPLVTDDLEMASQLVPVPFDAPGSRFSK